MKARNKIIKYLELTDVIPFAVSIAPAAAPVRGVGRVEWTLATRIAVPGPTIHSALPLLGDVLKCLSHSNWGSGNTEDKEITYLWNTAGRHTRSAVVIAVGFVFFS